MVTWWDAVSEKERKQNNTNKSRFSPKADAQPWGSIQVYHTTYKFPQIKQDQIRSERIWLPPLASIMPWFSVGLSYLEGLYCSVQKSALGKSTDALCPSTVCTAPLAVEKLASRELPGSSESCNQSVLSSAIGSYHLVVVGNQERWE